MKYNVKDMDTNVAWRFLLQAMGGQRYKDKTDGTTKCGDVELTADGNYEVVFTIQGIEFDLKQVVEGFFANRDEYIENEANKIVSERHDGVFREVDKEIEAIKNSLSNLWSKHFGPEGQATIKVTKPEGESLDKFRENIYSALENMRTSYGYGSWAEFAEK